MSIDLRRHAPVRPRLPEVQQPTVVDVSVLTPVYNEERFIRETVTAMQAQRFDGVVEFLFADGESDDATREILEDMASRDPRIRVFPNEARTIPAGLNVLLGQARGRYVARMDAHTFYPPDYLQVAVDRLRRGDVTWVSGPVVPVAVDQGSRKVSLALSSRLGFGGSAKWAAVAEARGNGTGRDGGEIDLDSGVFGGVWERSVVDELGGWDEGWPRNQDSEMAGRFLARGHRLVCLPRLGARYVPRSSVKGLARQYFGYGFYRAKTAARHPATLRRSHALAPGLVVAGAAAAVGRRTRLATLARLGLGVYSVAVAGETVRLARRGGPAALALPAVFATMHVSWGVGFLVGSVRFPRAVRGLPRLVAPFRRRGRGDDLGRHAEPEPAPLSWRHPGWAAALWMPARRRGSVR